MPELTDTEAAAQADIAARLAAIGLALPGTLLTRTMACGKPGCRCAADPPRLHGPYHQWTRKIDGTTRTRRLSDDQVDAYGPWFANAQQLRALTSELEALGLRIMQRHESDA